MTGEPSLIFLIRWELRALGLRNLRLAMLVLFSMAAFAVLWEVAGWPPDSTNTFPGIEVLMMIGLVTTPVRDPVADFGQLTFAFTFLRYLVLATAGFTRLILPGLAAGTVGNDRRTGRLQELQMTLVSARSIFVAKVIAAAAPFLVPALIIWLIFVPVCVAEAMPLREILRLGSELTLQVVATACVAVACSSVLKSPWSARVLAYMLIWLLLPVLWIMALLIVGPPPGVRALAMPGSDRWMEGPPPPGAGYDTLVLVQSILLLSICLICYLLAVGRLDPNGRKSALRQDANAMKETFARMFAGYRPRHPREG